MDKVNIKKILPVMSPWQTRFKTVDSSPENISKVLSDMFFDDKKLFKDIKQFGSNSYLIVYAVLKE